MEGILRLAIFLEDLENTQNAMGHKTGLLKSEI